jgi:hypothetical protein
VPGNKLQSACFSASAVQMLAVSAAVHDDRSSIHRAALFVLHLQSITVVLLPEIPYYCCLTSEAPLSGAMSLTAAGVRLTAAGVTPNEGASDKLLLGGPNFSVGGACELQALCSTTWRAGVIHLCHAPAWPSWRCSAPCC